jgi:4-alpha-glucanotransferase
MEFSRACGILLHPSSLPGAFGIGDFGPGAAKFVDFLAEAGQTYWQVLPLNPTGYGDSPYQCFSTFAGNIFLISPENLRFEGFLSDEETSDPPEFPADEVRSGDMQGLKSGLLRKAFERFRTSKKQELMDAYDMFCAENSAWLDDYALFRAVRDANGQTEWNKWDAALAGRDPAALERARAELGEQIFEQKFYQFIFFRQWNALRAYAAEKGVRIIGDIPIYVSHDSADVWCHPEQFKLNEDGSPKVVAGVPPDFFSKTGQLWGNPIYNWDAMRGDGFAWWVERVRFTLQNVDIARLDHFRGFEGCWEVSGKAKTAENGEWVQVPGRELFETLREKLGELPLIAEDLGFMTPEVEALRDDFDFPGMRILQFAFGGDAKHNDLPHNYVRNCVAYTGTHDNDTVIGWFTGQFDKKGDISKYGAAALNYLNTDGAEMNWDMVRALLASVADTAVVPLQDVLGLDNWARMNLPASTDGNWKWRFKDGDLTEEITARLKNLAVTYGRKF